MDLKRALTGGVAGLALIAGATGCGKLTEKATEKIVEEASGCEDIDIDAGAGGASGTCDGQQFDGSATGNASLPEGWPEDLAPPAGTSIHASTGSVTSGEFGFVGTVPGTVAEVEADIRGILEAGGYVIDDEASHSTDDGTSAAITASDGSFTAGVGIGSAAAEEGSVTVTWSLTQE